MIAPTKQKINQRWDTLPDVLRDALASETNSDFIWATCEAQHIPEKNISIVAADVAAVLMGFLRVDDIPATFQDNAGIDEKTAKIIYDSFNKKIFAPLKSTIDAIYKSADIEKTNAPAAVKIAKIPIPGESRMIDVVTPTPAAPPKPPLSGAGWSKIAPAALPKILSSAPSTIPAISPTTSKTYTIPTPIVPIPTPPIAPSAPAPAPMMLQTDIAAKTSQKNIDFHLSKSGVGAEVSLEGSRVKAASAPAMIEFSKASAPTISGGSIPVPPAPKGAVHYTEYKAPLASIPMENFGTRKVAEITSAAVQKSVAAPATATIPVPPKPPASPYLSFISSVPKPTTPPAAMPVAAPMSPKPIQPQPSMPPAPATMPPKPNIILKNFP